MLALILIPVLMVAPASIQGREEQVLRQFAISLDHYSRLHDSVSASVPRGLCAGLEDMEMYRTLLADEIRRLRAHEREGAIFTRDVGALIRQRLRAAAPTVTADDEETGIGPDARPIDWRAKVNVGYPPYFGAQYPELVRLLPPLPGELEYRFVGRDLVLLDVIANLIVDVLRDAIS